MADNFKADLNYGQLGEKFVSELGKEVSIEVKRDRKWEYTGNIFFEVECNGKISGIMSTEATYLVYLLSKEDRQVAGYILDIKPLKIALLSLLNDGLATQKDWSGDGGRVKGIIVSLTNIGELIKRMTNAS